MSETDYEWQQRLERFRLALEDIADSDPEMDDAKALISVARIALGCQHLYEDGGAMCLRCGKVKNAG